MIFEDDVQVLFEHAPDLLCGIELQVYGHRVSWSLHDYVETLEEQLADLFDAHNVEDAVLMGATSLRKSSSRIGAAGMPMRISC
ncbi:MAG: hypothetical protein R2911_05815 [Caldilineaceae bacterium]